MANVRRSSSGWSVASLCILACGAAVTTSGFAATVWNVDVGKTYGTYSGQGAFSDPGNNLWNLVDVTAPVNSGNGIANVRSNLQTSSGAPSGVGFAFSATNAYSPTGDFGTSAYASMPNYLGIWGPIDSGSLGASSTALTDDGALNGNSASYVYAGQLAFVGLTAGEKYDLYLYSPLYQNGSTYSTTFNVGGIEKSATQYQSNGAFVESTGITPGNYVLYSGVTAADGGALGGEIVVNFRNLGENGSGYWSVTGAQLVSVPEPASVTMALCAAGLFSMSRRRRGQA